MLFNFRLQNIDNIQPWGGNSQKRLHWFGLTDGLYWMTVGTDELFRYTDEILAFWNRQTEFPYVDYPVVRIWEDLLDILPNILEPVPASILQKTDFGAGFTKSHSKIVNYLLLQDNNDLSPKSQTALMNTTGWMERRFLDVGYLQKGPRILFCTDGQNMFIHWNNHGLAVESIPLWTANYGTFSLPVNQFIESIQFFNERLMSEMQARISEIQTNWNRPEIQIDIPQLIKEQSERSTWLEQSLKKSKLIKTSPWAEIQEMLEKIS